MAWQSGSASIPGVHSDGRTPAGITVDGIVAPGGLDVGTPNGSRVTVSDGFLVGESPLGGEAIKVRLADPVADVSTNIGGYLNVDSGTQGSSYTTAPGFWNVSPPAAQPTVTLVTSTITDANAKAAIRELIALVKAYGLAAITET